MCGIISYIGNKNAIPILLEGLRRLEYRGYDSAGLVVFNDQKNPNYSKVVGRVKGLEDEVWPKNYSGTIGIAHTRWATHGRPSAENAHPHSGCQEKIWVVHNGIIENYQVLKEKLQEKGHKFVSETDTEVLAHLIEEYYNGENDFKTAVREALRLVEGTYGLVAVNKDEPDKIIVARQGSPIAIGLGEEEYIIASDVSAILRHTRQVVYLDDKEMAIISKDEFLVINLENEVVKKEVQEVEWQIKEAEKRGYDHFMLKEIMEQPESITNTLRGRLLPEEGTAKLGGLNAVKEKLREIERIIIIACGTAYYAGLVGEYMIEEYAGIPVEVEYASEFRYRKPIIDKKTAILAISQSGETADTLAAIREGKRKGAVTLGIVNVVGSTIARETDAGIYNHAGPEIGVASTKAFTSQVTLLAALTLFLGRQRQMSLVMGQRIVKELIKLPDLVSETLKLDHEIKNIAREYKDYPNFLFLGRKYNYPLALEGALKLKEISYIHAEGYPAGEMKHGPIALIDPGFPCLCIVPTDSVYEKNISNIQELKARQSRIIAIATNGNNDLSKMVDDVIYIPKTLELLTPLLTAVPLQLFAYYVAVFRECDVDKPRNLAKSVTVE